MVELIEGKSYLVRLTVANRSTKAGVPVDAVLGVGLEASVVSMTIIPSVVTEEHFAPGETKTLDYPMDIPVGSGGLSGAITAWIVDPTGLILASASEYITITTPLPAGQFTVKVINYDAILARVEASWQWVSSEFPGQPDVWIQTLPDAQWYAQIPSKDYYAGWPIRYLRPSDGKTWRPLTEACPFLVPEGSEYWNPYPYTEIWIAAGPCCEGSSPIMSWNRLLCDGFGIITWRKVQLTPGCEIVFDLSKF